MWAAGSTPLELRVQMSQRSKLPGELPTGQDRRLAARVEITTTEEVRSGYDGRSHGSVFIGPLRPRQILVKPEIEAHGPMLHRAGGEFSDSGEQVFRVERLLQNAAGGKRRHLVGVRRSGQVQHGCAVGELHEIPG